MTETKANEEIRQSTVQRLKEFLSNEDVLQIKNNKIAFPAVNANGTEIFLEITVSVPRGSKTDVYDGYALAEDFQLQEQVKAEKKAEQEKKKAKKIKVDQELREKKKQEQQEG